MINHEKRAVRLAEMIELEKKYEDDPIALYEVNVKLIFRNMLEDLGGCKKCIALIKLEPEAKKFME